MSTSLSSLIHYTLTCGRAIIIKSLPFVSPGAPPPRTGLNITALPLYIPAANYRQTRGCVITVTSRLRKRLCVLFRRVIKFTTFITAVPWTAIPWGWLSIRLYLLSECLKGVITPKKPYVFANYAHHFNQGNTQFKYVENWH